jgi:hypothetical protein
VAAAGSERPSRGLRLRRTRGSCAIDYPAWRAANWTRWPTARFTRGTTWPAALLVTELGGVRVDGRPYGPGMTGSLIVTASAPPPAARRGGVGPHLNAPSAG